MKKKLLNITILFTLAGMKMLNDYKRLRDKNYIRRQQETLSVYEAWLDLNMRGKLLSDFLRNNSYDIIGIYGLGRLGRQLYSCLNASGIVVQCIVDNEYSKNNREYNGTPCYSIDGAIPAVDLYIVTVPDEVHQIKKELFMKTGSPIQSLQELMFMYR